MIFIEPLYMAIKNQLYIEGKETLSLLTGTAVSNEHNADLVLNVF